jgi:hypothetical protein
VTGCGTVGLTGCGLGSDDDAASCSPVEVLVLLNMYSSCLLNRN